MNVTREEYLNSPAALPPLGVKPNFENPENIGGYAFPLLIAVVAITNCVFLAKLWVLLRITKKMLWEDWILTLAWLVYAGFTVVAVMICYLPVGEHQWDIKMEKLMRVLYLYNTAWIIYGVLMILIKVNILLQYIRIFVPDGIRSFTLVASYGLIVFNTVYYIIFVFMLLFNCTPRRKIWDDSVSGHCLDWRIVLTTGNFVTFISDLLIWIVPQRVIWSLGLNKSRKWGLSILFTIGVFAIVCSGVRIRFQLQLFNTTDITYIGAKICFWGTCQVTAGFLIACLPTMTILYKNIKRQAWAEKMGSTMRTFLRRSRNDSGVSSMPTKQITTIGGGGGARRFQKGSGMRVTTDVEFDELVNRTDMSVNSQVSLNEEYCQNLPRRSEQIV